MNSSYRNLMIIGVGILCLILPAIANKVEINVKTGEQTIVEQKNLTHSPNKKVNQYDEWSTEKMDLSGVEIKNEGEDATGSMSPLDLMIRSFKKLPYEEQVNMGFINALKKAEDNNESVDINVLNEIWNIRQAKLKEAMESLSETAEVLMKLIHQLENSTQSSQILYSLPLKEYDEESTLEALYDLEDYLTDVDNARDFHNALGGWPILTSLITPKPRWTQTTPTPIEQSKLDFIRASSQEPTPEKIRGMAALVVGTAIKNEAEYSEWILESVVRNLNPDIKNTHMKDNKNVKLEDTVLAALLHLLDDNHVSQTTHRQAIYALGSGLRHVMSAQAVFDSLGGIDIFEKALHNSTSILPLKQQWSYQTKLINLIQDLLQETQFELTNSHINTETSVTNHAILEIGEKLVTRSWKSLIADICFNKNQDLQEEIPASLAKLHEAGLRSLQSQWKVSKSKFNTQIDFELAHEMYNKLLTLKGLYIKDMATQEDTEYYSEIMKLIDELVILLKA